MRLSSEKRVWFSKPSRDGCNEERFGAEPLYCLQDAATLSCNNGLFILLMNGQASKTIAAGGLISHNICRG